MKRLPEGWLEAAQAAEKATHIPSCVSIGQGALESAWGAKVTGEFNLFGIKALDGQPYRNCPTHEVIGGKRVLIDQRFRSYASLSEAFMDHAQLFLKAPVYAPAVKLLPDWRKFVSAMAPHYATDPNYARALTGLIEEDGLEGYNL
jgi:flagellar protein FlgJ